MRVDVLTDAGLHSREQRRRWAYLRGVPERLAVLRDAPDSRIVDG